MFFNHRYLNFCSFLLITIYLSSSTATFCSNLTSINDKDTPCFLETSTPHPARLRSSSSNLILPCHVARSKRSTVEWWYQDFQKKINIKIYPVYPAVRPTVVRFLTTDPLSLNVNETDIIDVSILLRNVDIDDSGIYRCVVRPWTDDSVTSIDDILSENDELLPKLTYHVELSSPRLCQTNLERFPCFQDTRTSSPTIVNAYHSAFLQCIVPYENLNAFWVVGNETGNHAVIIDYLTKNQYNGDQLRRVFPLSLYDYSIELNIDQDTYERTYSCVIDKYGEYEATLFTYIVRSINPEGISDKTIKITNNETTTSTSKTEKSSINLQEILSHDLLTREQIENLRTKSSHAHDKLKTEKSDLENFKTIETRAEDNETEDSEQDESE
ncbi:hypothetical protein I4U23_021280 [Adineta vaga]|nr:hypothetical protein I4U23_021280 [Adineta vaga]